MSTRPSIVSAHTTKRCSGNFGERQRKPVRVFAHIRFLHRSYWLNKQTFLLPNSAGWRSPVSQDTKRKRVGNKQFGWGAAEEEWWIAVCGSAIRIQQRSIRTKSIFLATSLNSKWASSLPVVLMVSLCQCGTLTLKLATLHNTNQNKTQKRGTFTTATLNHSLSLFESFSRSLFFSPTASSLSSLSYIFRFHKLCAFWYIAWISSLHFACVCVSSGPTKFGLLRF